MWSLRRNPITHGAMASRNGRGAAPASAAAPAALPRDTKPAGPGMRALTGVGVATMPPRLTPCAGRAGVSALSTNSGMPASGAATAACWDAGGTKLPASLAAVTMCLRLLAAYSLPSAGRFGRIGTAEPAPSIRPWCAGHSTSRHPCSGGCLNAVMRHATLTRHLRNTTKLATHEDPAQFICTTAAPSVYIGGHRAVHRGAVAEEGVPRHVYSTRRCPSLHGRVPRAPQA